MNTFWNFRRYVIDPLKTSTYDTSYNPFSLIFESYFKKNPIQLPLEESKKFTIKTIEIISWNQLLLIFFSRSIK